MKKALALLLLAAACGRPGPEAAKPPMVLRRTVWTSLAAAGLLGAR